MRKTSANSPRFFTPELFPAPTVKAPTSSTRQEIVDFVTNYAKAKCGTHENMPAYISETWNYLYGRLRNSSIRFDAAARARSIGSKYKIEAVDTFGYLDELYAIARRDLK